MGESDRHVVGKLFANVPADQQQALQGSFDSLARAIYQEGSSNPSGIEIGSFSSGLVSQLGQTFEQYMVTTGVQESDGALQGVMFGAMVGIEQDLGSFAQDLQNKLNLAGELRTDITEIRTELGDWPDADEKRAFSWTEVATDDNGNVSVTQKTGELTKAEAETLLGKLEMQLTSLTELNEMQKFDLQTKTHDYQQALSTLSNLLKSQHDSLMAIIRNLKA
jgi:hypothetical protein